MRNTRLLLTLLTAGVSVLLMSTTAIAETVLFEDDFDSGIVGSNPVATTGTWRFHGDSSQSLVKDDEVPGPVSSPNYLGVTRTGTWNEAEADFGVQSDPTDLIRMEADWYHDATYDGGWWITESDPDNGSHHRNSVRPQHTGELLTDAGVVGIFLTRVVMIPDGTI